MRFARIVYTLAGVWGLLVIPPMYWMYDQVGRQSPPAITHPEYYYGFAGGTLAWQIAFFVIARDPARFRVLMPVTWVEKFSFVLAAVWLHHQHRIPHQMFCAAMIDLALGILFVLAYRAAAAPEKV